MPARYVAAAAAADADILTFRRLLLRFTPMPPLRLAFMLSPYVDTPAATLRRQLPRYVAACRCRRAALLLMLRVFALIYAGTLTLVYATLTLMPLLFARAAHATPDAADTPLRAAICLRSLAAMIRRHAFIDAAAPLLPAATMAMPSIFRRRFRFRRAADALSASLRRFRRQRYCRFSLKMLILLRFSMPRRRFADCCFFAFAAYAERRLLLMPAPPLLRPAS